eukprot:scaffold1616_cov395-Prasinococcus_capsulatus_cf.AAC.6
MTGRSTVPSVWIGGHHIGGCDGRVGGPDDGRVPCLWPGCADTLALMQSGELEKKLEAAGAL